MRFVSLFAGVGGFDLAFERAGMEPVAQVEIDAKCREVLAKHWPDVPRFEDVHDVRFQRDGSRVLATGSGTVTSRRGEPALPSVNGHRDGSGSEDVRNLRSVDVLCGGFPCQDYSVAGKRGGLAGDRGALWWQFHRLIAECRPEWVVGENVPGLLSSNGGRDFGAIVGSLVKLGYGVVWRVLDAQYFGVAQRRRRVFIVGHSGGIPRPEILAFAEGCSGDTPPVRRSGTGTADHVATSLKASGKYDHVGDEARLITVASTLTAAPNGNGRRQEDDHNIVAFDWRQSGAQPQTEMSPTLRKGSTLDTLSAPPAVHTQAGVRRLTPLECERLQGFPDNWTAGQSDTQRYRQMGNAVAVPVVEWIGQRLMDAA